MNILCAICQDAVRQGAGIEYFKASTQFWSKKLPTLLLGLYSVSSLCLGDRGIPINEFDQLLTIQTDFLDRVLKCRNFRIIVMDVPLVTAVERISGIAN